MLHLLYALALLLLLCGACAILAERFTLSPALLPLPVLSGAVVVLYLCGVAGFLRVGAVAVLLALAAVWAVGLVQYRLEKSGLRPRFHAVFRRCCVYLAAVLCTAADVYPVG